MAPIHLRTGLAALWLALLPGAGCEPEAEEDDAADDDATGDDDDPGAPFTLIAVPDIQYVTLAYPEVLLETTGWIAEEADDRDILFTLQEGDLTHENSELEWDNASAGFDVLEDEPAQPYALCLGNHDGVSAGDTSLFHQYFPVSRFDHRPWFGGTMDPDQMDNAWFGFDAGPTGWLVLSLTYDPNSEVIAWASSVVEEHSDRRVIVLTHAYLAPSGELSGAGERIWDELVRLHPSMTLVLNGHYTGGEAARLLSEGDHGNTVVQLFANYQDRPFGGAGLIRILEVDPAAGELAVSTYSPWLDFHEEDDANQFTLSGLELGPL